MDLSPFNINCTGDVVQGDTILFEEGVFSRSRRWRGDRRIVAKVVRESYGQLKQQHTFTLKVLWSDGHQACDVGSTILRKGRVIYSNGTRRKPWADERKRQETCREKHIRGDLARLARRARIEGTPTVSPIQQWLKRRETSGDGPSSNPTAT